MTEAHRKRYLLFRSSVVSLYAKAFAKRLDASMNIVMWFVSIDSSSRRTCEKRVESFTITKEGSEKEPP